MASCIKSLTFEVQAGETLEQEFQIFQSDGTTPQPITAGSVIHFIVKTSANASDVIILKTSALASEVEILNSGTDGKFKVKLGSADTFSLDAKDYKYAVWQELSGAWTPLLTEPEIFRVHNGMRPPSP